MPAYPAPPFLDPSLNAGFVTGRGTGGGVTYGDPEIGGRPPRYQNWNVGVQYALTSKMTVGAAYAGSHGDFLGGSGRGDLQQPARSALSRARQPADAAGDRRQRRGGAGDRARRRRCRTPNFSGTIGQMLRPFPQYSGVTDVYGNVARSTYHSLQLTAEQRRWHGLTVNANYTFSRTEDDLAARTGYDFEQDWAVGVNDQPHVVQRHRRLRPAVRRARASRAAATPSCARW